MSDITDTPSPTTPKGLLLPMSLIVTILTGLASLVVTYVFATKAELSRHSREEGERIVVLEQTSKHQDKALDELKSTVRTIDQNVRTLMIQQGVPADSIAPRAKE